MKNIKPNGLSRAIGNGKKLESSFPEYVRRSMTLRDQKSAYVGMRKVGVFIYVKPGGTAG